MEIPTISSNKCNCEKRNISSQC